MRWTHFQTPRNSCVSALNCIILISDEADDNYRTDGDTNDESDGRTPLEKMLKMEIALRKLTLGDTVCEDEGELDVDA